jgi:hypothetical protein
MNHRCQFPRCRQEAHLIYIGRAVCDRHWDLLCETEAVDLAAEDGLLHALGLRRVNGEVLEIIS